MGASVAFWAGLGRCGTPSSQTRPRTRSGWPAARPIAAGIPTAIGLAAGHPDLVRGLVCEDGVPQRPNPAQKATLAPMVDQLTGPDYGAGMKAVYPGFFHPDTDRSLVD